MDRFVHLHVHTEFSLLDGFTRIDRMADRLEELGMDSVAITDHGVMYGAVNFYKKMKARGIKPIIGCEVYVAPRTRHDKDFQLDRNTGHLVLLVKDAEGYANLIKLVSAGFTEGFYKKPRIDYDILRERSKGLVILSSCMHGHIQHYLLSNEYDKARELALSLHEMSDDGSFYLELQDQGIEGQRSINLQLVRLSKDTGIPLVATNDVHYLRKEDASAHDALLCIQTGKTLGDSERMKFGTEEFYLKSKEEMEDIFKFAPSAISNTGKIADMCHFDFDFGAHHLPRFIFGEGWERYVEGSFSDGKEPGASSYLRELCVRGFRRKYGDRSSDEELVKRLEYELDTIDTMGYSDYFLIVWDFIRYAKESSIYVGPGRGSCGGSIVAYVLDITDVDPIKFDLIFERFLNPERITMPDIDIDFEDARRGEVIDYVVSKYGKDHVAQIITFGTLGAKAAVRDVGRVLSIPYGAVDAIAKEIPFMLGMTIDKALKMNDTLASMYRDDDEVRTVIDLAKKLEGVPRHSSTHAAGVVICEQPVDSYVPLTTQDQSVTTQYDMILLEELGLLKMDFLGLRTLTVIKDALELIESTGGPRIDISAIPLDDERTYSLVSTGQTLGIFQLESGGMRKFMSELKPSCLEDIIAGISLYRPGPMDSIPKYISNKNDPSRIEYANERLVDILGVTYGCIVYQEQVMRIVRELAGYSYGRSDLVRRAMSKKKMDVMEKERQSFIYGIAADDGSVELEGCVKRGVPADVASAIFDEMIDFARYAFNKSHAAGYAIIAYQTAYLKANYPAHFMAGAMSNMMSTHGKLAQYIDDARRMGIDVKPPCVNRSLQKFTVESGGGGESIRYGLLAIKSVGLTTIDSLVSERRTDGPFSDLDDFLRRMVSRDVNKKAVECLIKAGAMDVFGRPRKEMLLNFEQMFDIAMADRRRAETGQLTIFEDGGISSFSIMTTDEFQPKVKLQFEREMLGVYISDHPLGALRERMDAVNTYSFSELSDMADADDKSALNDIGGKKAVFICMVSNVVKKITKNGSTMAFITVEDLTGALEVIVFPNVYSRARLFLDEDEFVEVRGSVTVKEDEPPKIIADSIVRVDAENINEWPQPVEKRKLYVRFDSIKDYDFQAFYDIVSSNRGNVKVVIYAEKEKLKKELDGIGIQPSDDVISMMKGRFGQGNVVLK